MITTPDMFGEPGQAPCGWTSVEGRPSYRGPAPPSGHLAILGVSLTCPPSATGNGSLAFQVRYNTAAEPFDWHFGRKSLDRLLERLTAHEPLAA